MTQEGQGPSPEETITPPTSTRWSEEPVEDDPGIAPPFVPGRTAPDRGEPAADGIPEGVEVQGQEAAPPADVEPESVAPVEAAVEPEELAQGSGLPAAATGEGFPFDQFDEESAGAEKEEQQPGGEGRDSGWSPFDVYDETSGAEPVGAETAPAAEPDQEEPGQEEPAASETPWAGESDPWGAESTVEPQPEAIPAAEPGHAEAAASARAPGEEVASLLERMARMIREEGADAVRDEMESDDRLTSLLAGLLAGYLTGRS